MIDAETGHIHLTDPPAVITRRLTLTQLKNASWAQSAEEWLKVTSHSHWKLRAACAVVDFIVILHFKGEQLTGVSLTHARERESRSWANWSKEAELARKEIHDEWLARVLGRKRKFHWGSVESVFDPRSGASEIIVSYELTS